MGRAARSVRRRRRGRPRRHAGNDQHHRAGRRRRAREKRRGRGDGPRGSAALAELARELGIWLARRIAGAARERPARQPLAALSPDGRVAARYDKIHLFDVDAAERRNLPRIRRPIAAATRSSPPISGRGSASSICYDLRFPQLYRALARPGATVLDGAPPPSPSPPARPIGTCCCAPAPSRTALSCWRAAQGGRHENGRRDLWPSARGRSMGRGHRRSGGPARRDPGRSRPRAGASGAAADPDAPGISAPSRSEAADDPL